jgi:hypothetical protein
MSAPAEESALLDFDGWLGAQPVSTRSAVQGQLSLTPEADRPLEKQRLASMFAVSKATGLDPDTVNEKWDIVRGGFAEQQGEEWYAVKDDEGAFFNQLQQRATQQRDERHLLLGADDPKAPDAQQKFENSLFARAQKAAYDGDTYANALSQWQESAKGSPGYLPERASAYEQLARNAHAEMSAKMDKVRPIASAAYVRMAAYRNDEYGQDAAPFELLRGLSPEDKQLAFRVMGDISGEGADKGQTQAFFEAVWRGYENMIVGGGSAAYRSALLGAKFREGDQVRTSDPLKEVQERYTAEIVSRSGASPTMPAFYAQATRPLTADEAKAWNAKISSAVEDLDTAEQLRKFGQESVDSTKVGGWVFQKVILPAADSAAIMSSLAIPGAWAPAMELNARNYQGDEYARLRSQGMDARQADRLAAVAGAAQSALDKVEFGLLEGGLPFTKHALEKFALKASPLARFGANFAGTAVAETVVELTQDHVVPALVQDNLTSDPAFDVHWGDVWREVGANAPETFLGMVLLSGLGGVAQTREQSKVVKELGESAAAMRLRGYSLEEIQKIQAAPAEARGQLLAEYLPAKAPEGEAKAALIADVLRLAAEEKATFNAKKAAETTASTEAADYAIRVARTDAGWQVTKANGAVVTVDTPEAARRIRDDLKQAETKKEAEALVAIIDAWHSKGTGRETTLTGEQVRSDGQTISRSRDGQIVREITDAKTLQTLREEARMDASATDSQDIDVLVNGSNSLEFTESVAGAAKTMIQRLELNQSESTALTAIHEQVESTWRAAIARGIITIESTQRAIAGVAAALDPAKARDDGERAFRERVQRVADGTATETETRETVSELAVAEVIGRRKDGAAMPAGSVSAALDAAITNATNPAEVKALGKFRAFLRAAKTWFRGVLGTVAAIKKARKEGQTQDFDALVDRLLGLDEQARHSNEAAAEAEAIANQSSLDYHPPTAEEMAAGVAFSLSPAKESESFYKERADALRRASENTAPTEATADEKTAITDAYRQLVEKSGFQAVPIADVMETAGIPYDRKGVVMGLYNSGDVVSLGHGDWSLSDERRRAWGVRVAGEPSLLMRMNDGENFSVSPGSRLELLQNRVQTALAKNPAKRLEIARNAALKLQELQYNWETDRLTAQGDKIRPLVERRSSESLDSEQAVRQATHADDLMRSGVPEKQARNQAREAAFEWRKEQDAMQSKDYSPKARLLRDLRTLDAILGVLPAEIRGKVGGFVKLATLGSDKARLEEINRRVDKMGTLVEKYLQAETSDAMRALIEKAKPSRDPGKQSRGKLGAEAHRYFDKVEAAMDLTKEQVEAEQAAIDAAYNSPTLTNEQAADLFEQQQILDTFGAFDKKSAADMDAALTAAQDVYDTGRNERRIIEEQRLAEVQAMADDVVAALGGVSDAGIQKNKKEASRIRSKLANASLDLKSFSEVLDALLGRDHPLAQKWTRAAREGFAKRNDDVRELRKRWKGALEEATGKRGVAARRLLWNMGQEQTITVDKEGRSTGGSVSVPISLIDSWKDGSADPAALGYSPQEAVKLISERDAMVADDRRKNLELDRSTRADGEKVPMTQAEGIFLTMLAAQEQYTDALSKDGYTPNVVASIEEQLTGPAKKLREFMRNEYRDGYGPLASIFERMYGVALPQIRNYAPAAFYHVGAERTRGPEEGNGLSASGMRAGFLANRKRHTAAPRLENAFATFFGHASQTAHWKGLAEFVREFSGVIGRPEVKKAIESKHGEAMLKAVNDWVRNIEGNGIQKASGHLDGFVRALVGAQAHIALAFRLGTIIKQSSAILGAAYKMPLGEYAKGFAKLITGNLEVRKVYESETIQRRLESGYAPEVRAAMDDIWTAKPTRRAAILEAGMEFIGLTDAIFTTGSAAIAYDYHYRQALDSGMTAQAAEGQAMREVEDIVGKTAQPADVVDRSLFESRQGQFGRLMFMYASEARQKSSLVLTAWKNTLTGKASAEDIRTLVVSHLIAGPLLQAITAAWRDARDDDDNEWFDAEHWKPKDFLFAIVAGPLAGIPLVGDALSGFGNDGVFSRIGKAGHSLWQLGEQVFGEEKKRPDPEAVENTVKKVTKVMQGLDAFTGVAGSVIEQAFTLGDNFLPDSEGEAARKDRLERSRERKAAKE